MDGRNNRLSERSPVMDTVLAILFLVLLIYLLVRFERQDNILEDYEDAVFDVEGRLAWAAAADIIPLA